MEYRSHECRVAAVCLVVAFLGCAESASGPSERGPFAIDTDATSYLIEGVGFGSSIAVDYDFTNLSDETIYFVNCGGTIEARLDRWTVSGWRVAYAPAYPLCLSPPVIVSPGGTESRTFLLHGLVPDVSSFDPWEPGTRPPGTYRLVVTSAVHDYDEDASGFGRSVALEFLTSNPFEVRQGR